VIISGGKKISPTGVFVFSIGLNLILSLVVLRISDVLGRFLYGNFLSLKSDDDL